MLHSHIFHCEDKTRRSHGGVKIKHVSFEGRQLNRPSVFPLYLLVMLGIIHILFCIIFENLGGGGGAGGMIS